MTQDAQNEIMVYQSVSNKYVIQIHRDIDGPEGFSEIISAIQQAGPDDHIDVSLCTGGGSVFAALLVRDALMKTPASTKAIIGPECSSAGTVIALACDEWELNTFSAFMIHACTHGVFGKQNEVVSQYEFKQRWLKRLFDDVYTGFLSDEEAEQVVAGKDIWLDADQLAERLGYYAEYRKALYEAEQLDSEAEQE